MITVPKPYEMTDQERVAEYGQLSGWNVTKAMVKSHDGRRFTVGWTSRSPLGQGHYHWGGLYDHLYSYIDRKGIKVWVTEPYVLHLNDLNDELQKHMANGWDIHISALGFWNPGGTIRVEFSRE